MRSNAKAAGNRACCMVSRYTRDESAGSMCGIYGNVGASPQAIYPRGPRWLWPFT